MLGKKIKHEIIKYIRAQFNISKDRKHKENINFDQDLQGETNEPEHHSLLNLLLQKSFYENFFSIRQECILNTIQSVFCA